MPVHPRVCGERASARSILSSSNGSSPRVRGTVRSRPARSGRRRFIPACAGNGGCSRSTVGAAPVHPRVCGERSPEQDRPPAPPSVHPRVCGERCGGFAADEISIGSSPRVRGTGRPWPCDRAPSRFIPACAGNGRQRPGTRASRAVHPRVCGERPVGQRHVAADHGSSPRVRGTGSWIRCSLVGLRFIPACAGNGPTPTTEPGGRSVHPRVCGERRPKATRPNSETGSSPRVRGTAGWRASAQPGVRFIPACAGNGPTLRVSRANKSVHPRVCGERRFIPACAGNGPEPGSRRRRGSVHPRVCGEREAFAVPERRVIGSSPRVRGTA